MGQPEKRPGFRMLIKRQSQRTLVQRLGIAITAGATLVLGYLWGNDFSLQQLQKQISAKLIRDAPELPEFQFSDQHGKPFSKADLNGHWSFLHIGCLTCPQNQFSILPLFAQVFNRVADRPGLQESTRFLFLSNDVAEGDSEASRSQSSFLHPGFIGLHGQWKQFAAWLDLRGEVGAIKDTQPSDSAKVSPLFLISPSTRLIAGFTGWVDAETIAGDFKTIVDHFGN